MWYERESRLVVDFSSLDDDLKEVRLYTQSDACYCACMYNNFRHEKKLIGH